MVFRIVIAGKTQCSSFAEVCLIADYLAQQLPNFCYERIEKPVKDWDTWLCKLNQKNKWHHIGSPIIWKELLMKGSKPYFIGGVSEFFDYCHSYYNFDSFLSTKNVEDLIKNLSQFKNKIKQNKNEINKTLKLHSGVELQSKHTLTVCISGAGFSLALPLIYRLLNITDCAKSVMKIYIYDKECSTEFLKSVEYQCNFISTNHPGKVVKHEEKIGSALANSDLFIILDHVPFQAEMSIGDWLHENQRLMTKLAVTINYSASQRTRFLFPNLGPSCYNATVLRNAVNDVHKNNIVVATSDLGLEISNTAAEIAEIPVKNMFCPPVWGFVGINHLVDIRTTIHKYNYFEPYNRYTKVSNSPLKIGCLTPEMRTLEYLFHFDNSLWKVHAQNKATMLNGQLGINKAIAVFDVIKAWLLNPDPENIINLGIACNGSFGLNFKGIFSQPAKLQNEKWIPAHEFLTPKDPYMKLPYLQQIAELTLNLYKKELPQIVPYYPCICKLKLKKHKAIW